MATDGPGIVDCHIHPALDNDTDLNWFGPSGDVRAQIDDLRRAGIARACGAPVQRLDPVSFAPVRRLNDLALALRDRFPRFYVPGIQVHPRFPDESCAELDRCCGGEGVRWIGELVGYLMGYGSEYATPAALTIMRHAAACGAVVNLHSGELGPVATLCRAVSELRVVLAHPGDARDTILERLRLVGAIPNLHLDISGSGIDRYGLLRTAVAIAGPDKLLFGSDYPINNPAVYVYGLRQEALSSTEREAIFAGNFWRLTGL